MRLSFGAVTLDTDRRQVFAGNEPLHVSAKAFQLLELLVENRPRALSKDELQQALWPDTFVSDTSLTTLINELRAGLGESAREPRLIRTVHGFGYAFEAPGAAASGARLVWGAIEVPLYEGENVLGRDPGPRGAIPDASVSRRHARLTLSGGNATLEDLGSKNGTFACDRRVDKPTPLTDGDPIRLGLVTLVFRAASSGASTKTAAPA
jgi:DNA-binding winged helix-turn-helix (wHTH) protein